MCLKSMIQFKKNYLFPKSNFVKNIRYQARLDTKKILFPESDDVRVLKACSFLKKYSIVEPILIGSSKSILKLAKDNNINLKHIEIIETSNSKLKSELSLGLYKLRKHKGITEKGADKLISQKNYFGTMLLKLGYADGLVSGATHSTADTIRPALQIIKTNKTTPLASSMFFMTKKDKLYLFSDSGLNVNPDAKNLAQIAKTTAHTANMFNIKPKVALLSFSTKGSGKSPESQKVIDAYNILKKDKVKFSFDGELQFDSAIIESVAKSKKAFRTLRAQTNTFIFPDLNSGNIGYKIAERLGGFTALGPIMQGLDKPVNDLSRGCKWVDIVDVAAITAVQSQMSK